MCGRKKTLSCKAPTLHSCVQATQQRSSSWPSVTYTVLEARIHTQPWHASCYMMPVSTETRAPASAWVCAGRGASGVRPTTQRRCGGSNARRGAAMDRRRRGCRHDCNAIGPQMPHAATLSRALVALEAHVVIIICSSSSRPSSRGSRARRRRSRSPRRGPRRGRAGSAPTSTGPTRRAARCARRRSPRRRSTSNKDHGSCARRS